MRKVIIFLSAFFAAVCVILIVISPDFLSMLIVGIMTVAIILGFVFGIIPLLRYTRGFKKGQKSIENALNVNADYIWTAVRKVTPFFEEKQLDELFEVYLNDVVDQSDKGVVISNIEDSINEDTIAIRSWRSIILQIAGILTALGLLGTFLGLVMGISTVEFSSAEATMDSIEMLLRGIGTAFYTSIVGVILSILFNISYRLVWNTMLREMGLFTEQFHTFIQPSAEEQIRAKQYLNTEKMIEALNVLRANSSIRLSNAPSDPAQEQRMMMDILSGLNRGEFTFTLEPVCSLTDRSIIKVNTKLHWEHPVLGAVQPSVYLPIVEADGFVAKLDQHLWEQVCITQREWIDRGLHPLPAILSIRKTDLLAIDAYDTIHSLAQQYDLQPRYLEVAIDESAYTICHDEAMKAEKKFLQSGYKVSVGNCNGNLVGLVDTKADEISLDLSILPADSNIENIFNQAANIHLTLSCAGITSAKELADIKRYGCLVGRGTHLYPEMTRLEYEKLMQYPGNTET